MSLLSQAAFVCLSGYVFVCLSDRFIVCLVMFVYSFDCLCGNCRPTISFTSVSLIIQMCGTLKVLPGRVTRI